MTKIYRGIDIGHMGISVTIKKTILSDGTFYIAEAKLLGRLEPIQALARNKFIALSVLFEKIALKYREHAVNDIPSQLSSL